MEINERQQKYWSKNLGLTGALLALWFIATFVVIYFARELNAVSFLGFPLGFYMSAQGSLIIYVLIIAFYAYRMNKMDDEYGVAEDK